MMSMEKYEIERKALWVEEKTISEEVKQSIQMHL